MRIAFCSIVLVEPITWVGTIPQRLCGYIALPNVGDKHFSLVSKTSHRLQLFYLTGQRQNAKDQIFELKHFGAVTFLSTSELATVAAKITVIFILEAFVINLHGVNPPSQKADNQLAKIERRSKNC